MKPNVCSLVSLGLHHVLSLTPLAAPNSIHQEELLEGGLEVNRIFPVLESSTYNPTLWRTQPLTGKDWEIDG